MQRHQITENPFALLMNPEAVHAALAQSGRLKGLKSQVWRPLDQPLLPHATPDLSAFDDSVDTGEEDSDGQHRSGEDLS